MGQNQPRQVRTPFVDHGVTGEMHDVRPRNPLEKDVARREFADVQLRALVERGDRGRFTRGIRARRIACRSHPHRSPRTSAELVRAGDRRRGENSAPALEALLIGNRSNMNRASPRAFNAWNGN